MGAYGTKPRREIKPIFRRAEVDYISYDELVRKILQDDPEKPIPKLVFDHQELFHSLMHDISYHLFPRKIGETDFYRISEAFKKAILCRLSREEILTLVKKLVRQVSLKIPLIIGLSLIEHLYNTDPDGFIIYFDRIELPFSSFDFFTEEDCRFSYLLGKSLRLAKRFIQDLKIPNLTEKYRNCMLKLLKHLFHDSLIIFNLRFNNDPIFPELLYFISLSDNELVWEDWKLEVPFFIQFFWKLEEDPIHCHLKAKIFNACTETGMMEFKGESSPSTIKLQELCNDFGKYPYRVQETTIFILKELEYRNSRHCLQAITIELFECQEAFQLFRDSNCLLSAVMLILCEETTRLHREYREPGHRDW